MARVLSDSFSASATDPASRPPRIWLLIGDKLGDNAQIQRIAQALGWPCETRRVLPRAEYVLGKPRHHASLAHLDPERSDTLAPPWPDLILTVGRRPSMAALWVRARSGGRSRVVILGRPRRRPHDYALIIAPGQYRLPRAANVLPIRLPLMACDPAAVAAASERWRAELAALPRPLTGVLVGGPTKPYVMNPAVAGQLLDRVQAAYPRGTLYLSTSRRTPESVVEALEAGLPTRARLFRWRPEATDNPYLALLGLADNLVVSGDSISMLVEAIRLGRTPAIFALPARHPARHRGFRRLVALLHPAADGEDAPLAALARGLQGLGLDTGTRDIDGFHELLIRQHLAVPLGAAAPEQPPAPGDELDTVVARIRTLWPG